MNELSELEKECHRCAGSGIIREGFPGPYYLCRGTGYEITEAGEKVMKLMERHFKRLLKEQIR